MLSLVLSLSLALAGEPVDLGGPARAFALPTLNSSDPRLVSLYDHAGLGASDPHKAVVVHFFRAKAGDDALAELSRLARKHPDLQVIGIISDPGGMSAAQAVVQASMPTFPVLFDEFEVVFGRYGVVQAPLTIVMDGDARVAAMGRTTEAAWIADLEGIVTGPLQD